MRQFSRILISGTLAAIAASAGPLAAQEEAPTAMPGETVSLSPEQQAEFDTWPPDQQYAYETWPAETKAYYWSLAPKRQMMFWRLSDEDKIALTAMTGPERDSAWQQIEARAGKPPAEGAS